MAQLVAHHTGSVGVTGSNPVSSTNENCPAGYAGQFFVSWGGMDSPIGALRVVGGGAGVSRVCFAGEPLPIDAPSDHPAAAQQLAEYFAGQRRDFTVPLDLRGVTAFRGLVLRELAKVPYGRTTTYAELARAVGNPKAVRAVGSACATNPLPLLIPCHRVLRSDGQLGGYRGGVQAKRYLLELEGIDV